MLWHSFPGAAFFSHKSLSLFFVFSSSSSLPCSVHSSGYSSPSVPPFLTFLFPPSFLQTFPIPVFKASVGSESFWAVEGAMFASADSAWIFTGSCYAQLSRSYLTLCSRQWTWARSCLGCGSCMWKLCSSWPQEHHGATLGFRASWGEVQVRNSSNTAVSFFISYRWWRQRHNTFVMKIDLFCAHANSHWCTDLVMCTSGAI